MSPDGSTKPLPEEKLLGLIRDKGSRAAVRAPAAAGEPSPSSVAAGPASARTAPLRWPVVAAGGLGVLVLLESVYLVIQLVRPLPMVRVPVVESPPTAEPTEQAPALPAMPSLAQSASGALFTAPAISADVPTSGSRPHGMPSAQAKLLASRLTLMGIMAGESPQAIIEDSETKKTYFVTTGQVVVEGSVLEQGLDNRVILDLDGEKIELSL